MAEVHVAMALLDGVEKEVTGRLDTELLPNDADKFEDVVRRAAFCADMVKRCEVAEKKMAEDKSVLLRSLTLKTQLYWVWHKACAVRETQEKMFECYEKALPLLKDPAAEAELRYRYGLACRDAVAGLVGIKEKETANLQKAMQLAGPKSPLGIKCAKELGITPATETPAAEQEPKKGGCFIATACYGAYDAPEVMVLRQFRDDVLLKSRCGKALVTCYYAVSPPVADFIAARDGLKRLVRLFLVAPAVRQLTRRGK